MAKRKDKLPASAEENPQQLDVKLTEGKSKERCLADAAIEPAVSAAFIAAMMSQGVFGVTGVNALTGALRDCVQNAKAGDLAEYEGMLGAQAYALNAIFLEMTRRAAMNMGTHLGATEQYMRLALKAQSQARTTIETLAEVKNPKAVAFVKQANIANNQQVNNGDSAEVMPEARAGTNESPQTKLLEGTNVTRLDARAKGQAGRSHPPLEAVARVHRAKVARRKGAG
jgi:hypothetical protein